MFIEILVVGAILMYLYARGWLDFSSPWAVAFSIAIALVAVAVSIVTTTLFSRWVVNGLLGFGNVPAKKPVPKGPDPLKMKDLTSLERAAALNPKDPDVSKRLADRYLSCGLVDKFIAEKLRILEVCSVKPEEKCTIYHRLADIEIARNRPDAAIPYLEKVVELFAGMEEAHNAKCRIRNLRRMIEVAGREAGT